MLELRLEVGNVVLSLRPGGGDALTRGLNEVRRKINGGALRHTYITDRPCGSVAQWSECSYCMREVLGSSPGRAMCFFLPCDIWWLSVGPCSGCE